MRFYTILAVLALAASIASPALSAPTLYRYGTCIELGQTEQGMRYGNLLVEFKS
jgi:hypothetical protein